MSSDEQSTKLRTENVIRNGLESTTDEESGRYVALQDGDATIVCDRENPDAWIRSTDVRSTR